MADNEKDFIPESRNLQDEPLAEFQDSLDPIESRLAKDVQRTYSSYAHANVESLWRVQQRLESQMQHSRQSKKTTVTPENRHTRKYTMKNVSTPGKTGWSRWSRTISTIAAVLVVAIIAGSALLLFNSRSHSTQVGSSLQVQLATPKPALPTPTPQTNCSPQYDPGEHAVCVKGLETALNVTKIVAGQKITIFAGYADTQRILLKYSVEKVGDSGKQPAADSAPPTTILSPTQPPAGVTPVVPTPTQGQSNNPGTDISMYPLTMQGNIDLGGGATSSDYDKQTRQYVTIVSFFANKVPAGTKELHLTAHIMAFKGNGVAPLNDTMVINTPLPFHAETRVATPNQTVTVNGQAVTLERVVVTSSQTLLYLKNPNIAFTGSEAIGDPQGVLSGLGWSIKTPLFSATTSDGTKQGAVTGGQFEIDDTLMDKAGPWTFTMQTFGGPAGQGTWTFKFTVPPQSQK